ncbi:MAG: SDR family NAD(P)-dependent oxidoreductase [Firmicutes bacterium]|nr:SDR family NAD(P)-dependent oxidoreductase [Bacillota bacterium]
MKKILFTGARSGIAASVIEKLLHDEYYIYVTVHTLEQLKKIRKKYENFNNVECFKLDVNSKNDRDKLKDLDIDIFVSNAAIGYGGSIVDTSISKLKDNFETNVFSNFAIVQIVLQNMLKKDNGKIIMISSFAGIMPLRFLGFYCATKASIIKLTQCLRKELKLVTKNIHISLILPGMYHTGFNQIMLENKYPISNDSIFKNKEKEIKFIEELFWETFEYKKLDSITNKIYKAIIKPKPKFIYSAPLFQKIGAKLYQIFKW